MEPRCPSGMTPRSICLISYGIFSLAFFSLTFLGIERNSFEYFLKFCNSVSFGRGYPYAARRARFSSGKDKYEIEVKNTNEYLLPLKGNSIWGCWPLNKTSLLWVSTLPRLLIYSCPPSKLPILSVRDGPTFPSICKVPLVKFLLICILVNLKLGL